MFYQIRLSCNLKKLRYKIHVYWTTSNEVLDSFDYKKQINNVIATDTVNVLVNYETFHVSIQAPSCPKM